MVKASFKDKVVIITGATGGIGKELVKLLAKQECRLAIFARRENKLKKISEELIKNGTQCIFSRCDVANKEEVKKSVEFVYKTYGHIDLAILTAGVLTSNPLNDFNSDIIKKTMEINYYGSIYFIEFLLPILKSQKKGIIAAVSTLTDKRGHPNWSSYQASKAALTITLECLRIEAKKHNIQLITIKPGSVKTPMVNNEIPPGGIEASKAAAIILKGIKNGKKRIEFPLIQSITTKIVDLLPGDIYDIVMSDEK